MAQRVKIYTCFRIAMVLKIRAGWNQHPPGRRKGSFVKTVGGVGPTGGVCGEWVRHGESQNRAWQNHARSKNIGSISISIA